MRLRCQRAWLAGTLRGIDSSLLDEWERMRDPNYLARQGIEIMRISGGVTETLKQSDVDWSSPDAAKGLVFVPA